MASEVERMIDAAFEAYISTQFNEPLTEDQRFVSRNIFSAGYLLARDPAAFWSATEGDEDREGW